MFSVFSVYAVPGVAESGHDVRVFVQDGIHPDCINVAVIKGADDPQRAFQSGYDVKKTY